MFGCVVRGYNYLTVAVWRLINIDLISMLIPILSLLKIEYSFRSSQKHKNFKFAGVREGGIGAHREQRRGDFSEPCITVFFRRTQ
jgi:hypothetical protein